MIFARAQKLFQDMKAPALVENDCLVSVMDYSYAPFALGDAITWQVNASILAHENDKSRLRLMIVTDPYWGHFSYIQPEITSQNYIQSLTNLLPAFQCAPFEFSLHFCRNKPLLDGYLYSHTRREQPMWPAFKDHNRNALDFYSHKKVNRFFADTGTVPRLKVPRGYENKIDDFKRTYLQNKFVVVVNIRQRAFTDNHCALVRDSPLSVWYPFFDSVYKKYPDVVFVNVGGMVEWERDLAHKPNVLIPRTMGLGLGEELGLLLSANLFMGTSSGFAAAATFSDTSYIITHFQHYSAADVGISVGDRSYPFARKNQILDWQIETHDRLNELFAEMYRNLTQ